MNNLPIKYYHFLCLLLCIIAGGVIFFFWPGFMSPDAQGQLAQAISGYYSDHHPPLMSMYWRLWLCWRQGPEPIFLTYQVLLFFSTYIFLRSFNDKKVAIIIPFIPLVPHILFYSGAIWKDVGFCFSYLCVAALLTSSHLQNKPLALGTKIGIWFLLFFGTGVKYQAVFVLPIMAFWVATQIRLGRSIWTKTLVSLCIWASITGGDYLVKRVFTTGVSESHSWQKVKLFDLAGISVRLNEDLLPDFVQKNHHYSFQKVKEMYSPFRVDELLVGWSEKGSLIQGEIPEERDIVWNTWFKAVKNHPLLYLRHRAAVWKTMVYNSPVKSLDELKSVDALPPLIKHTLKKFERVLYFLKEATRFIYYVPLIFIYLILGVLYFRRNSTYAVPLIFMNLAGLSLMGALFIFSMASDLRYIYLTMTFLHFSHPLAWGTVFYGKR